MAYFFLILAGILNTVQSGANSTLQKASQHPFFPAIVAYGSAFLVTCLGWAAHAAWTRKSVDAAQLAQAPWWAWIGGLLGFVYVMAMVNLSRRVGAGVFTGLTVTAGIVASIVMDHFGLVGFEVHRASAPRLVGAALMIAGIVLVGTF